MSLFGVRSTAGAAQERTPDVTKRHTLWGYREIVSLRCNPCPQGVLAGNLFGVAVFNALAGASLEIVTWGVFDLAKYASTFNPGDKVYWDNVNLVATSALLSSPSTTPGNREIGVADLVPASDVNAPGGLTADPTVRVRLNLCSIGLVTSSDMDPGLLQKITVVLTAAQIEGLTRSR